MMDNYDIDFANDNTLGAVGIGVVLRGEARRLVIEEHLEWLQRHESYCELMSEGAPIAEWLKTNGRKRSSKLDSEGFEHAYKLRRAETKPKEH